LGSAILLAQLLARLFAFHHDRREEGGLVGQDSSTRSIEKTEARIHSSSETRL
jgi:hypothetical protein